MFEYPRSGMFNLRVSYENNSYRPPVDVVETKKEFIIRVEIAGVNEKDFSIRMDHNTLFVSGIRHDPMKNHAFHQMEIHFGEFQIEVKILQPVDRDSIRAEYIDGFLTINIAKAVPQEIHIKDKEA